jgi:CRP/FNR family transcriptional regulator, anaerobic regulatory protein
VNNPPSAPEKPAVPETSGDRVSWSEGSRFPLHRPELLPNLERGEAVLTQAMASNAKTFEPGETIVAEGEPHRYLYWLRTGWVARVRRMPDQRNQIITVFLPGDFFGVKTIFLLRQPDAIEALSSVSTEFLDYRDVLEMVRIDPDVSIRLWWQICEDQRRLHRRVTGLGRGNAEERIAAMLLDFRVRADRAGLVSKTFRLPMTQQQIANYLGLTVVHVNRVLKRLRDAEAITFSKGRMTIRDLPAIQQIAYPLQDALDRSATELDEVSA